MRRWQRILLRLLHRIWVRAALFSVGAIALALVAAWVAPFIPYNVSASIGAKAVDHILDILASSMLAVTTFSLTAMVSAFSGATTTSSPRATALLIEDSRAQNALSTFLGAFLFAIVGICALSTGFYGETGRVFLFAGTMLVIVIIVVTLLRWVQHLSTFGRMDDVVERVERVATLAARQLARAPRIAEADAGPPADAIAVEAGAFGYVTHIDLPALAKLADEAGAINVAALPGAFVSPDRPLGWIGAGSDADEVRDCFTIERTRAFDQDPRFGLVVLGEIASRALSPAVNDPGTAIAVLDAGTRVVAQMAAAQDEAPDTPGVHLPRIAFADLVHDLFRPVARDGAGNVEVGIRLQRTLASLVAVRPEARPILARIADDALARATAKIDHPADLDALRAVHARCW